MANAGKKGWHIQVCLNRNTVYQLLKHKVKPRGIYKCFSPFLYFCLPFLWVFPLFACCPHQQTGVLINWTLRTSENK
uniref:GG21621 n=1 Tax=Drosophila erecta TaxID=7220 RepID=B3P0J3_DROER